MSRGLVDLPTAELEAIRRGIERGSLTCPLTEASLVAAGLAALGPAAVILCGHSEEATLAIIEAALAERSGHHGPAVELVWTGPEVGAPGARDTAVVVRELFASARKSVVVAGFAFDHGADILAPLHAVMRDHGVDAAICLDIPRAGADITDLEQHADRAIDAFLMANWPFGAPVPTVRYDPRTIAPDSRASLHAKCIVVDDARVLITSANFTSRGQERNIEVGVVIEDPRLAKQVAARILRAISGKRSLTRRPL